MIEYTWNILQMEVYPQQLGSQNVVFNVHWNLTGNDGTYSDICFGSERLALDSDTVFTPYEELTETQVVNWIKTSLGETGVTELELTIARKIQNQITPPVIMLPLPWNQ